MRKIAKSSILFSTQFFEVTVITQFSVFFTGTCSRIHSKWILNDRKLLVQKNLIYDKTHHFKVNPCVFYYPEAMEWIIFCGLQLSSHTPYLESGNYQDPGSETIPLEPHLRHSTGGVMLSETEVFFSFTFMCPSFRALSCLLTCFTAHFPLSHAVFILQLIPNISDIRCHLTRLLLHVNYGMHTSCFRRT